MPPEGSTPLFGGVVSRREARLLFWLVVLALVGVIFCLSTEIFAVLSAPAIILFIAWLMSYVLLTAQPRRDPRARQGDGGLGRAVPAAGGSPAPGWTLRG